ncbi:MAG: hypothetical protein QME96_06650 [Myxococcota bacterium]|nr:hypothetical protein [Myxococcota bacterium]
MSRQSSVGNHRSVGSPAGLLPGAVRAGGALAALALACPAAASADHPCDERDWAAISAIVLERHGAAGSIDPDSPEAAEIVAEIAEAVGCIPEYDDLAATADRFPAAFAAAAVAPGDAEAAQNPAGAGLPVPLRAALPPAGAASHPGEYLYPHDEPSLLETLDAAVAAAGLDPSEEAGIERDAGWAALLPSVRLTVRRDWEHDRSLDLRYDGRDAFGIDTDDDLEFSVSLQWNLSDLVAPPVAVAARRLALQAESARRALRLAVAAAYVECRRLRLQWEATPPEAAGERAAIAVAVAERTARLDALTGGFFGRAVERHRGGGRDGRWSSDGIDGTR